jgi:tetratricopeptide (TPR) repeat protein
VNAWSKSRRYGVVRPVLLVLIPTLFIGSAYGGYRFYEYRRDQNTSNLLSAAQRAAANGELVAAAGDYRRYLKRRPADHAALRAYADVLYQSLESRPDVAVDLMRTLHRLNSLEPDNIVAADRLIQLYLRYHEFALAEQLAALWLEREPANADVVGYLVQAQLALKRTDAAAATLADAIERMPDKPTLLAQMVLVTAFDLKDFAGAGVALAHALEHAPQSAEVHLAGFHLYRSRENQQAARHHLETAVALDPDSLDALIPAIVFYSENRELDRALAMLDRARAVAPDDTRILLAQVEYVNRSRDRELIERTADALLSRAREFDARLLIHAADLYLRIERLDKVDECLTRLDAMPRVLERLELLGPVDTLKGTRALFDGQTLAAVQLLREAARANPDNARTAGQLALALWDAGDLTAADDVLHRLLLKQPDEIDARLQLAEIRWQQGAFARARALTVIAPPSADPRADWLAWINAVCRLREARVTGDRPPIPPDLPMQWEKVEITGPLGLVAARWALRGLVLAGERESAERLLDDALPDSFAGPKLALEAGLLMVADGRADDALSLAERLTRSHPDAPEGAFLRLRALATMGRMEESEALVHDCTRAAETCAQLWDALGDELLAADRVEDALDAFRRAAALKADSTTTLVKLIEYTSDLDEALAQADSLRAREGRSGHRWKYALARAILRLDAEGKNLPQARDLLEQCLVDRPQWVAARLLLGFAFERGGLPDKAAEQYRTALAQEPALYGKPVGIRLVVLLEGLGRFVEADAVLAAVAEAMPDSPDLLRFRTQRFVRRHEYDSAVATAEQLLAVHPDDPALAAMIAELHLRLGRPERAEAVAREALAAAPQSLAPLRALARVMIARGMPDAALDELRTAATEFNDGGHYLLLAQILAMVDRSEESAKAVQQAVALSPSDPVLWAAGADLWGRLGRFDDQVAFARKAVELQGESTSASTMLAELLINSNRAENRAEAGAMVNRRLTDNPDDVSALLLKARMAILDDPPDRTLAVTALQRAVSLAPADVRARKLLAEVLLERGQFAEALASVDTALFYAPEDLDLMLAAGRIHCHRGDFDRAIPILRRLLELRPRTIDALRLLGNAYDRTGQINRAIEIVEQVCRAETPTAEEHVLLAELYERAGRIEDAERSMETASRVARVTPATFERILAFHVRRADCATVYDLAIARRAAEPDDVRSRLVSADLLGSACGETAFAATAADWLADIRTSRPEHTADVHFIEGMSHYHHGRLNEAETAFLRAVEHSPTNRDSVNALTWLYAVDLNRPLDARNVLTRFTENGGREDARLMDTHATMLIKLGQLDRARRKLEECLAYVGPSSTRAAAHYHLGLVLRAEGNTAEAAGHIRLALQLAEQYGGLTHAEREEATRLVDGGDQVDNALP